MKDIISRGLGSLRQALTAGFYAASRRSGGRSRRAAPAAVEPLELRVMLSAGGAIHPNDANGAPPGVVIPVAPTVTSANQSTEQVNITFTDSAGIDASSITPDNITVTNATTGAQLSVTAAAINPSDGSGTTDVATYTVAAPDASGFFSSADNGVYSVALQLNQVFDPDGDEAPQAFGSFTVNVTPAGVLPPVATITAPATVTTPVASVSVVVTYVATAGTGDEINAGTINTGNITVTGPNGALTVTAVNINPTSDATTVIATYTVAAPSGVFSYTNDGTHTIAFNPNEPVQDVNGISAVSATASSTFGIELPSALVATISTPIGISAAQPTETVSIVYADASGINLATITTNNIVVAEQNVKNPAPLTVTGVSLTPSTGTPTEVTATYTIAAPNGNFSLTNNGTYDVTLQNDQVEDVNSVFAVTTSSTFTVLVPGSFTLLPSLTGLKLPASIATGTPLKLSVPVTVINRGTIASGGTSAITLYASTTQGLTGATEIADVNAGLRLKPNKGKTVKISCPSLPTSLTTGPYYLIAQVTDINDNSEIVASGSTVAVAPAFIDLSGSLQPVPAVLKLGKKTSATVTVTNNGNVSATETLQVQFFARPAGTTGSADVPLATPATRIKLASGASKRLRFSFVPPTALIAGTSYTMVAVLDPANLFNDSDLANNTLVGTYIFTVE